MNRSIMFKRWWTYQQERFPLLQNGLLIAVFSSAAVSYSALLRQTFSPDYVPTPVQTISAMLIAFMVVFLFFVQLRIADEFKDFNDDVRYRSYRPVPRGLVTLRELGILGIGSAIVQLGLTFALGQPLLLLLLSAVWAYMGLMAQEFFVPTWLKAHPLVYMVTHALIMPLIALYATGCDWLVAGATPPNGLLWFLLVSVFSGMAIEIGRKIRAPRDEERRVETYTALWGRQKAVMAWLGVVWFNTLSLLLAGTYIRFTVPVALVLLLLLTGSVIVAWRFLVRPKHEWAKRFELMAGLWTVLGHFSIGLLPLVLKGWG